MANFTQDAKASTLIQFVRPPIDRDKFDIYNTTYAADIYESCTFEDRQFIRDAYQQRYSKDFSKFYELYTGNPLPSDDDDGSYVSLADSEKEEIARGSDARLKIVWDLEYAFPFEVDSECSVAGVIYINGDNELDNVMDVETDSPIDDASSDEDFDSPEHVSEFEECVGPTTMELSSQNSCHRLSGNIDPSITCAPEERVSHVEQSIRSPDSPGLSGPPDSSRPASTAKKRPCIVAIKAKGSPKRMAIQPSPSAPLGILLKKARFTWICDDSGLLPILGFSVRKTDDIRIFKVRFLFNDEPDLVVFALDDPISLDDHRNVVAQGITFNISRAIDQPTNYVNKVGNSLWHTIPNAICPHHSQ